MNKNFPVISIAIPTFNEEKNILNILSSIYKQNYPKSKLEVFVVDNGSLDDTVKLSKKYPVKVLHNSVQDAQYGKMLAFNKARGEFFTYFDADIELRSKNYFHQLLLPLLENKEIVASFTRMYVSGTDSALTRYLTFDPIQRDPVYEFFSPSIESTITEDKTEYSICTYSKNKIPPAALCLFRKDYLKRTPIAQGEKFMDLDNLAILVEFGYTKFAYVPQAGFYHHHVFSFSQLVNKRLRNISRNYLPNLKTRHYTWFSANSQTDVLKMILLILYAHSFFLPLVRGIYRSRKFKDWAGLLEPIVVLIITDTIVYGFLRDSKGRQLAWELLRRIFTIS